MPFVHVFTALTLAFLGFINPILHSQQHLHNPTQVLASTTIKAIIQISIQPSPPVTSTPTFNTTQVPLPVISKAAFIDCIGPDGKHLRLTQNACDSFNNAWHHAQITQPTLGIYGQAAKVGEHTYELQVTPDNRMATVQELLAALNQYRQKSGVGVLGWNASLGTYAQNRANFFSGKGSLDEHAGFMDFIHNENGFTKLGFNHLGENSAFAGPLSATHLIEGIFAADAEHNGNQLNNEWTQVGIGVNGIATDVIFGGNPL